LDPLDPLTEIVKSGQAFSSFILIERLIWLIIGIFFIGAMSSGVRNGIRDQGWFSKTSFIGISKRGDKKDNSISNKSEVNKSNSDTF
tara:strand:- start:3975 stop:4235 length:261 start_codon:yes stop_codon:yes gene_type:complete